jgi:hypothetical protein
MLPRAATKPEGTWAATTLFCCRSNNGKDRARHAAYIQGRWLKVVPAKICIILRGIRSRAMSSFRIRGC